MENVLTLAQTLLDAAKQAEASDKERYEALGIAQRLIEPNSWLAGRFVQLLSESLCIFHSTLCLIICTF